MSDTTLEKYLLSENLISINECRETKESMGLDKLIESFLIDRHSFNENIIKIEEEIPSTKLPSISHLFASKRTGSGFSFGKVTFPERESMSHSLVQFS